ncbi:MAG: C40 family peptidase [Flavobacteriales bacterium]|nr:C40 family peptidase [Flavobacteriales bacterium]
MNNLQKTLVCIIGLLFMSFAPATSNLSNTNDDEAASGKKLRKKIVKTALKYEGTKYRGGGTTEDGMDCSGLIYAVFQEFEITLPRSSFDQSKEGVDVAMDELKIGDLLFFNNNPARDVINHVGMVIEINDDEILFIHTSSQKGVMISSMNEPYHKQTFVKAKDILD